MSYCEQIIDTVTNAKSRGNWRDAITCLAKIEPDGLEDTMTAQAAVEAGAREAWIDERTHNHQQIIERQEQGRSELDNDELFEIAHGFAEAVRRMRKVFDRIALFPFQGCGFGDTMPGSQLTGRKAGGF